MPERFVIDNSVVMSWCFQDEANEYAETILDSLCDCEAIVPAVWPLEVGNVLVMAERRNRLRGCCVRSCIRRVFINYPVMTRPIWIRLRNTIRRRPRWIPI